MRGEKTEEEAMKEQWLAKMRGEEKDASGQQKRPLPPDPLSAVDLRTRVYAFISWL